MKFVNHIFYGDSYVASIEPSKTKDFVDQPLGTVIYKDRPDVGHFDVYIKTKIPNISQSWETLGSFSYATVPATPLIKAQLLMLQGTQLNSEPPLA